MRGKKRLSESQGNSRKIKNCLKVLIMDNVEDQELALGKTYIVDKKSC